MELVVKAAAIALIACVCVLIIKNSNPGGAYLLAVCSSVILMLGAALLLSEIADFINALISRSGLSPAIFLPIIKCTSIGIIVSIVSGLCKDAGQSSASFAIEYLGAACAVYTALPLIATMLNTLEELL